MHRAHAAGLAGATVLRGIEGYGASQHVHTTRLLSLTEDLPVVIVMVDEADRIERFALELDELITEGLVVIDDVEVVRYVGRQGPVRRGAGVILAIAVGVAAALGAACRYLVDQVVQHQHDQTFPGAPSSST